MKRIKCLILMIMVGFICSCSNKIVGTWCLYTEIPSTLIILESNVTNEEIQVLNKYLDSLSNMKSHDLIEKIEDANKMINVYYTSKDNIDNYEEKIKTFKYVKSVENNMLNQAMEKLIITKSDYTYDTNMFSLDTKEYKGKYKFNNNILELEDSTKFYYKDKFLCYDNECNKILTKSKNNLCN